MPAGMTPTMVNGWALMRIVWPITAALPPNRACQSRVAENRDASGFGLVFFGQKPSAQRGRYLQHARQVICRLRGPQGLRPGVVGHLGHGVAKDCHGLDRLAVFAPGMKVGVSDPDPLQLPLRRGFVQIHQPLGFSERQGAEVKSVERAEDGGGAADADRQQAEDGHTEEGLLDQNPNGESDVPKEYVEEAPHGLAIG